MKEHVMKATDFRKFDISIAALIFFSIKPGSIVIQRCISLSTMTDVYIGDYKNSWIAKELITQIHRIPELMEFKYKHELILFRSLFFIMSDHGKYYEHFWDMRGAFIAFPTTWDHVNELSYNKVFYADQKSCPNSGHLGHICAKSIPPGEMVYNCFDCGMDPTCCLCSDCFNEKDHIDHDVTAHISTGNALCDCGDETSWKVDLNCPANKEALLHKGKFPDLPLELKKNIAILIRVLFDFILDVNVTNLYSLPDLEFINNPSKTDFLNEISKLENLPYYPEVENEMFKGKFTPWKGECEEDEIYTTDMLDYYFLVVWNDEFHNFEEASSFLREAYGTSSSIPSDESDENAPFYEVGYLNYPRFGMQDLVSGSTKSIDYYGITVIKQSKDRDYLLKLMKKYKSSRNKLTCSVMSSKEYINLALCRSILVWFKYILQNDNTVLTDFIKDQISLTLLEPANFHLKKIPLFDELRPTLCHLNSDLEIPIISPDISSKKNKYEKINELKLSKRFIHFIKTSHYAGKASRLQYLTFFELRFPKKTRNRLKDSIVSILTNTVDARFEFGRQVMELLPTYEFNNAFYDREWHLSILETFRLQIYHDPNAGTRLLHLGLFENVLNSTINVLEFSDILHNNKYYTIRDYLWTTKRYKQAVSDTLVGLQIIIGFVHKGEVGLFKESVFLNILRLFTAFDEIFPLHRESDMHVERQDPMICMEYYNIISNIYKIAESLGKICSGVKIPNKDIEKCIILTGSYLKSKGGEFLFNGVVNYDITDKVSILHPIICLFGELMRWYPFYDSQLLLQRVPLINYSIDGTSFYTTETDTDHFGLFKFGDEALQPWVFNGQLNTNFWIRNGSDASMTNECFDSFKPESSLFVMQQAIILGKLPVEDIVERYMLTPCIYEGKKFTETVYDDKISLILSEFMSTMYYLLSFRQYFDTNLTFERQEELFKEYYVAISLAPAPLRYSELKKTLNTEIFENILDKVAKYIPPATSNDYGRYTLNDEHWSIIDPYTFIMYEKSAGSSDIEESIIKHLAEIKNKNIEDIVINPYLYPLSTTDQYKFRKIGAFMRSSKFVKVLFKILEFSLESDNDAHLSITLHLIHALILDAELYDESSDSGSLKSLVDIPICNLLLSTIEKPDIPLFLSKKASTILELLLLKDDDVLTSLITCFGETHISEYKKSQHGKNLETSLERKKRLALKRQKKALKKMKKQQEAFFDQNKTHFHSKDDTTEVKTDYSDLNAKSEYETRNCILCMNPETEDSLFGIPCLLSVSSAFWKIPTFEDIPPTIVSKHLHSSVSSDSKNKSCCTREKLVVTGCPHGMHYSCFKTMLKTKKKEAASFLCPLCKNQCNLFLPSFKSRNIELDPNFPFTSSNITKKFQGDFNNNISYLQTQMFEPSLNSVLKSKESLQSNITDEIIQLSNHKTYLTAFMRLFFSNKYDIANFAPLSYSFVIGSTLEMNEICTRKNNEIFIPEIQLEVLKSLVQFRTLQNKNYCDDWYVSYLVNQPNLGFLETLMFIFMETSISLKDSVKLSLIKNVVSTIYSLVDRSVSTNLELYEFYDIKKEINESNIAYKALSKIVEKIPISIKDASEDEIIQQSYNVIAANFKNYQRQIDFVGLLFDILPTQNGSRLMITLDQLLESYFEEETTKSFSFFIEKLENKTLNKVRFKEKDLHQHIREGVISAIDSPIIPHFIDLPEKLKDLDANFERIGEAPVCSEFQRMRDDVEDTYRYTDEENENPEYTPRKSRKNKGTQYKTICLHCGEGMKNIRSHHKLCKLSAQYTFYFTPALNKIRVKFSDYISLQIFTVESPYLNRHGEPSHGLIGHGDSGILDKTRYENLQKSYYDQTLFTKLFRKVNTFGINEMSFKKQSDEIPGIYEPNRKNLEQEKEFFGNMSDHELGRNPLNDHIGNFLQAVYGNNIRLPQMGTNGIVFDDEGDDDNENDDIDDDDDDDDYSDEEDYDGNNVVNGIIGNDIPFNVSPITEFLMQQNNAPGTTESDDESFHPEDSEIDESHDGENENAEENDEEAEDDDDGDEDDEDDENQSPNFFQRVSRMFEATPNSNTDFFENFSSDENDLDFVPPESAQEDDDDDTNMHDADNIDGEDSEDDEDFDIRPGFTPIGRMVNSGHVWRLDRDENGVVMPEYIGETSDEEEGIFYGVF